MGWVLLVVISPKAAVGFSWLPWNSLSLGSQAWPPRATRVLWATLMWLSKETYQASGIGPVMICYSHLPTFWWLFPRCDQNPLVCLPAPHQCYGSHCMEFALGELGEHRQAIMSIIAHSPCPCGWHSVHTSLPGLGTQAESPFGFFVHSHCFRI